MELQTLKSRIGSTKRQLDYTSNVLDELYQEVLEVQDELKDRIKEVKSSPLDVDVISDKITSRMIYLNQVKNKPLLEVNARLDELARLLDWMGQRY